MATAPITLTAAPPTPDRADRATFSSRAIDLDNWTKNVQTPELQTLANGMYTNALEVAAAATSEAFVGVWSALTGALSMPASVSHNGKLWVLTANLADVTTAEPGVDAVWTQLATGAAGSTQMIQYNNSGALDASGSFLWNEFTSSLVLGLASIGSVSIKSADGEGADVNGVILTIKAGDGITGAGEGGGLVMQAGVGEAVGGNCVGLGGDGGAAGDGGNVAFQAGTGGTTSGAGGTATLAGGNAGGAGAGGGVDIVGGQGVGSAGGSIVINGGTSDTGAGGSISITAATSVGGVNVAGGSVAIDAGAGRGTENGGNITLTAGAKGASSAAGNVVLNGTGTDLATNATGGFVTIPTCNGTPTGVPAGVIAGNVAMVFDRANSLLYIYDGGWVSATFA